MREEEILIDLSDPVYTKTIRSRQNDKNGLKMTVNVREKGKPIDLTGYAVKYEATNRTGTFIREDAQIMDEKKGIFAYTLSAQAVSTSDDWTAYFVMEKSAERMSTPDIRITCKRDAREGNIKIENYISEFDGAIERVKGYRKELDEAHQQIKDLTPYIDDQYLKTNQKIEELGASIAANHVVKKGGDTMTGALVIGHTGEDPPLQVSNSSGQFRFLPQKDRNAWESATVDGKTKDLCISGPNHSLLDTVQIKTKELTVDGVMKQGSDIGWTNLSTTGVGSVPDRNLKYKRSGDQVSIIGSIRHASNVTTFATLPAGCKPVQNIAFPALAYGNVPTVCEVTVQSDGGIFVNGVQSDNTVHIAMSYFV